MEHVWSLEGVHRLKATFGVAAAAITVAAATGAPPARGASPCPARDQLRAPGTIEQAGRQARRLIPAAFHASTPGNDWAYHPLILQLVLLAPGYPHRPGVSALRRVAVRRCGAAVANDAWAVVVAFPGFKVAGEPPSTVFLVNTRRGWRLWH
jgi:hypothetical protein